METTKETKSTRPNFARKRRVGFDLLTLDIGETVFAKITKFGTHNSKQHGEIDYFDLINLNTGAEQRMWVDGGLRGALTSLGEPKDVVGMSFEIMRNPKVAAMVEIDGKLQEKDVNSYSVWEISH